jgi:hypothetical protein
MHNQTCIQGILRRLRIQEWVVKGEKSGNKAAESGGRRRMFLKFLQGVFLEKMRELLYSA